MKAMITLLVLLSSQAAFSRQYIQCGEADSWNRMVVNLNNTQSTLFMTNGVHLPDEDRISQLRDLSPVSSDEFSTIYQAEDENTIERVIIPSEFIGVYANSFYTVLEITKKSNGYTATIEYSCFSALYED